jgi:hypothetical protein
MAERRKERKRQRGVAMEERRKARKRQRGAAQCVEMRMRGCVAASIASY